MGKKKRIPIPEEIAAEILYLSDRTCCVCNEKGKGIQIHHIDEDPSNNLVENLSVLCLDCHHKTQIKGGFVRELDSKQIGRFNLEWIRRVEVRRLNADKLVSTEDTHNIQAGILETDYYEYLSNYAVTFRDTVEYERAELVNYLYKISEIKSTVYKFSRAKWESGTTLSMNDAYYEVIDFYEEILSELSIFYPNNHFEGDSKRFFNELISSKYKWHKYIIDTFGLGRNGTMVSTMVASVVMSEIDSMIKEMAYELSTKYEFDFKKWELEWGKTK
jgi:hypothetical protein